MQGSNGETYIENRLMDMGGNEAREGEMCGESNLETYITICKIDSQWEFAVCLRKLFRGSVSTWRRAMRREVQEGGDIWDLWLIHVEV